MAKESQEWDYGPFFGQELPPHGLDSLFCSAFYYEYKLTCVISASVSGVFFIVVLTCLFSFLKTARNYRKCVIIQ